MTYVAHLHSRIVLEQDYRQLQEGVLSGGAHFFVKNGNRRDEIRIDLGIFLAPFAGSTNTWRSAIGVHKT